MYTGVSDHGTESALMTSPYVCQHQRLLGVRLSCTASLTWVVKEEKNEDKASNNLHQ